MAPCRARPPIALDAGIGYPFGCQSGNCGACKSHLVKGEVTMEGYSEFALSDECKPEPGRVYRAEFTVRPDGAVSDIHATGDAACARDALARWISSFRYEARQAPASTVVDWMLVEARRGG
jgi:hypothetical protein